MDSVVVDEIDGTEVMEQERMERTMKTMLSDDRAAVRNGQMAHQRNESSSERVF